MKPDTTPTPEEIAAAAEAARTARDAHARRLRQAHAEPLPGPLDDAFGAELKPPGPGARALARLGYTLRQPVAFDHVLLKRIDSPVFRQWQAALEHAQAQAAGRGDSPQTEYSEEEIIEFVFLFCVPSRQARALVGAGRERFREAAMAALADTLTLDEFPAVIEEAVAHYLRSAATIIRHEAPAQEGEQRADFSRTSPAPATASAGGSTTLPSSAANTTGARNT